MEANRRRREAEEAERRRRDPGPSLARRLEESDALRGEGNAHFRAQRFAEARESYDAAFVRLFTDKEEFEAMGLEDKARLAEAKATLHLNRAACKLRLGLSKEALWDSDRALDIRPREPKAHFRRASALAQLVQAELAKEKEGRFWDVERTRRVAQDARAALERAMEWTDAGQGQLQQAAAAGAAADGSILALGRRLDAADAALAAAERAYRKSQVKLYRDRIFGGLRRSGSKEEMGGLERKHDKERGQEEEGNGEEDDDEEADMPELEDSEEEEEEEEGDD